MARVRAERLLPQASCCKPRLSPRHINLALRTSIHTTASLQTDGVFRALTESRITVPWIDAFNKIKSGEKPQDIEKDSTDEHPKKRDLTPKKMSDSYHRVVLPLAQDKWLSDTYLNSSGHIRLGTIFMDLDALSGIIAYKHTKDAGDVTTVTAALDRISIKNPLLEICDLEYSGHVTYATGRSSMEITCKVAKAPPEGQESTEDDVLLTCSFTMVSLDPKSKKAVNIPALELTNSTDRALFDLGAARSKAKKALSASSLLSTPPDARESALIHSIWLRQLAYHDPSNPARSPANVHAMSSTKLQTASIMQPQNRNRHQTMIFGGFLLKQTFELAFCCAANFAHARPSFVCADPCTFRNPVPVGSVLYLTATVVHTDPAVVDDKENGATSSSPSTTETETGKPKQTRIQVRVDSKVRDVEHGTAKPTGQFHYTFTVDSDVKVMPRDYSEYMMYIDAGRRARRTEKAEAEVEREKGGGGEEIVPNKASAESLTE